MVTHRTQITLPWLIVLLMLTACAIHASPQQLSTSPTGAPTRTPTGASTPDEAATAYLDDRSSTSVLLSPLCNAVNRREYAGLRLLAGRVVRSSVLRGVCRRL